MESRLNIEKSFSLVEHKDFRGRSDFLVKRALFPSKMIYAYLFIVFLAYRAFAQGYFYLSLFILIFFILIVIHKAHVLMRYWDSKVFLNKNMMRINHVEIKRDEIDDVIKVKEDNCILIMRTKIPDIKRLYPIYNEEAFECVYIWLQEQGFKEVTVCSSMLGYAFHKRKRVRIETVRQRI